MILLPSLNESIKKIALNLMENESLATFMFGVVTKEKPLEILVEQRLPLDEDFLVLTKTLVENEPLKKDDKVVLIRQHGGQKYLVIDRVV